MLNLRRMFRLWSCKHDAVQLGRGTPVFWRNLNVSIYQNLGLKGVHQFLGEAGEKTRGILTVHIH
jgi:hypothetical protein